MPLYSLAHLHEWDFSIPQLPIFGSILVTNIGTNKRPPKKMYLSALDAYWNEYSTCVVHVIPVRCTCDIHVIPKWCTYDDFTFQKHLYGLLQTALSVHTLRVRVIPMECTCGVHVIPVWCTCDTHVVYMWWLYLSTHLYGFLQTALFVHTLLVWSPQSAFAPHRNDANPWNCQYKKA